MMTIPQGWEVVPLESCAEITNSNVDKKTVDGETIVKLCNYMDVYSNTRIDKSINFMIASATDLEIQKFTLQKDDVIITKDSESPEDIGIPAYVSENLSDVICGYHLTLVRPNEICNGKFLSIALSSDRYKKYYGKLASGSTRYALSMSTLNNTPILLPPLYEQQKIAEILSGIDRYIEATQTLIDKEKMIKKGLMADLLNHGIDEEGRIRTPQTHRYIESPLGMIPEGWEVKRLGEIGDCINGLTYSPDDVVDYDGILVLRSSNIQGNKLAFNDNVYVRSDMRIKDRVQTNDILICVRNGSKALIGKNALISKEAQGQAHGAFMTVFRTKNYKYIFQLFQSDMYTAQVDKNLGATINSINNSDLLMFQFPMPMNLAEQQKIAQILSAQDRKIESEEANLAKLQNLKKALMADLLSGNVRVKV